MLVTENWQTVEKVVSKLIAQAWMDEEFKQNLLANPTSELQKAGLSIESNTEVLLSETAVVPSLTTKQTNSATLNNFILEIPLPAKPNTLTEENINAVLNNRVIPFCT